jgi:hypothetical protein
MYYSEILNLLDADCDFKHKVHEGGKRMFVHEDG